MPQDRAITVRVFRFDPSVDRAPHYESYTVPMTMGMSVLNVLLYINEHYDGGLAHYLSCRIGCCKACVAKLDGKNILTCNQLAEGDMTLDPASRYKVIKDLLIEAKW